MKVFIGKYLNWYSPYQLADLLQKVGVSEDRCHKIGKYLSNTFLMKICEWIDKKRNRKIKIKIHDYDTWSMDNTLSIIILPLLKEYKKKDIGTSRVRDEDVPGEIQSIHDLPKDHEYEMGSKSEERWKYVVDEIIWTFEQLQPDNDWEAQYFKDNVIDKECWEAHQERISNGLILFGKYYQSLCGD